MNNRRIIWLLLCFICILICVLTCSGIGESFSIAYPYSYYSPFFYSIASYNEKSNSDDSVIVRRPSDSLPVSLPQVDTVYVNPFMTGFGFPGYQGYSGYGWPMSTGYSGYGWPMSMGYSGYGWPMSMGYGGLNGGYMPQATFTEETFVKVCGPWGCFYCTEESESE